MIHQPLGIPHKEAGLLGPQKSSYEGVPSGFAASTPFSFDRRLVKGISDQLLTMQQVAVLCRTSGKVQGHGEETSPESIGRRIFVKVTHHPHIPFR